MTFDTEEAPIIILLMGPPGAGKGTHAAPLSAQLNIPHISTGDLFRENIRNTTFFGNIAKNYINGGHLVPDEVVLDMLFSRLQEEDCKQGYILDGFPRTVLQAEALEMPSIYRILALYLNVPDSLLIERISGRIACKKCGKPYHKIYGPPLLVGVCDICGAVLYQRDDDKKEIFRIRLEGYRKKTEPLIAYYKNRDLLYEVDGTQNKEEVFLQIKNRVLLNNTLFSL